MKTKSFLELKKIGTINKNENDDLFICFASFEQRCLGIVNKFDKYRSKKSIILKVTDEKSELREEYSKILLKKLNDVSEAKIVPTEQNDPIVGMKNITEILLDMNLKPGFSNITIDISTFTKKQLFLILHLFEKHSLFNNLRLLYTEPLQYAINMQKPMTYGLKKISVIPTFSGDYNPQEDLFLIIFLGYEGDRALALWENIEPHKTIAVIPKPAYRKEWEGKTEQLNSALLAAIDSEFVYYSDSIDPYSTKTILEEIIIKQFKHYNYNWYIAPLGTKIQCVGTYYFMRKYHFYASLIYASPLIHNEEYFSDGIGRSWAIPK